MSTQGPPNGYALFSVLIARHPELEVYRRFRRLSSRNLLYLQSELFSIEAQLDQMDKNDREDELRLPISQRKAEAQLYDSLKQNPQRMDLVMKLRCVVQEYRKGLQSHG